MIPPQTWNSLLLYESTLKDLVRNGTNQIQEALRRLSKRKVLTTEERGLFRRRDIERLDLAFDVIDKRAEMVHSKVLKLLKETFQSIGSDWDAMTTDDDLGTDEASSNSKDSLGSSIGRDRDMSNRRSSVPSDNDSILTNKNLHEHATRIRSNRSRRAYQRRHEGKKRRRKEKKTSTIKAIVKDSCDTIVVDSNDEMLYDSVSSEEIRNNGSQRCYSPGRLLDESRKRKRVTVREAEREGSLKFSHNTGSRGNIDDRNGIDSAVSNFLFGPAMKEPTEADHCDQTRIEGTRMNQTERMESWLRANSRREGTIDNYAADDDTIISHPEGKESGKDRRNKKSRLRKINKGSNRRGDTFSPSSVSQQTLI